MSEINARALTTEALVRALKAAGSRTITEETVARDVADGFDANPDGTVDIFRYAAWLLKKEQENGG